MDEQLVAERAHLSSSRTALKAMRQRAEELFTVGDRVAGDAYTAEQLGRQMAQRIKDLADNPDTPLFFGRLTMPTAVAEAEAEAGSWSGDPAGSRSELFHIGRRHVTDATGEPMVLDWRAPLSRRFYRASARDPQGVSVRRRYGFVAGQLTSFEDERLDRGEELGTTSAILTAEIERPRVGPMRDIVATIQPEQDELVRAGLDETICVQGAPGTGKTAVGLHRAAYLLYLHRERLRRAGVLIVGPNRAFLHYIASVLPALGEIEVAQSTMEQLLTHVEQVGSDAPEVAALKHDPRMARLLHNALWSAIGGPDCRPAGPIMVSDGSYRWRIDEGVLGRIVDEVRAEALDTNAIPYAVARERVRARVVGLLQRQAEARRAESPSDGWLRRMGKSAPVTEFMNRCWPAVTPTGLVLRLFTDAQLRDRAGQDLFDQRELDLLGWAKPPRTVRSARWSPADALLIDEVAGLLDREAGYGHIVVDEAQDLSPMQARALARRSTHGSLTILGDLAQGTAPWAARDWRETLAHLGKPQGVVVPLSVGFRVPAVVVELANRLLPALDVVVPAARSLRRDGTLEILRSDDVATAARQALTIEGSVGVIAADHSVPAIVKVLEDAGLAPGEVSGDARLTVVPASLAKGLEYDHVVVVEPADIVDAEERGLHRLYVVLTRAVTGLTVLHTRALPAPL